MTTFVPPNWKLVDRDTFEHSLLGMRYVRDGWSNGITYSVVIPPDKEHRFAMVLENSKGIFMDPEYIIS